MSKTWNYASGDWWAYCDVCNKKLKASRIKKRWDGLLVCPEDFEVRHNHDFIKVRQDKITVPFTSLTPSDEFVSITYTGNTLTCTPVGQSGVAGFGVAGCSVVSTFLLGLL